MQITPAFLCLNVISIFLNVEVGLALALAEWSERYTYLGLFSLTCWGILALFQVKLCLRYLEQYKRNQNGKV